MTYQERAKHKKEARKQELKEKKQEIASIVIVLLVVAVVIRLVLGLLGFLFSGPVLSETEYNELQARNEAQAEREELDRKKADYQEYKRTLVVDDEWYKSQSDVVVLTGDTKLDLPEDYSYVLISKRGEVYELYSEMLSPTLAEMQLVEEDSTWLVLR